jgi:integrase/recombinase XerC
LVHDYGMARSSDAAADKRRTGGAAGTEPTSSELTLAAPNVPDWFTAFLADRGTRKPSVQTMKAYRQDFVAIATLLAGGNPAEVQLTDITRDSMRAAFAAYAAAHQSASIRRCWSTWNMLCNFLYTAELIAANPMPHVGRPKAAKTLPKALPRPAVSALIEAVDRDRGSPRRTVWPERDLALILTARLAGLRADELRKVDIGDIRTTDGSGAVIYVRGKSGKDRSVPVEADLLAVIEEYLASRARRFQHSVKSRAVGRGLAAWPPGAPLFVGRNGERITRGALQSRVRRAFRHAGPAAQPVRVRSCTDCATPTPLSLPTPMSACTR